MPEVTKKAIVQKSHDFIAPFILASGNVSIGEKSPAIFLCALAAPTTETLPERTLFIRYNSA